MKNEQKWSNEDSIASFSYYTKYYATPPSSPENELKSYLTQNQIPMFYKPKNESQDKLYKSIINYEEKYQTQTVEAKLQVSNYIKIYYIGHVVSGFSGLNYENTLEKVMTKTK